MLGQGPTSQRDRTSPLARGSTGLQCVDKDIHHADWITLVDEIDEALRQNVNCPRSIPETNRFIKSSPRITLENHSRRRVLTQGQARPPRPDADGLLARQMNHQIPDA